MAGVYWIGQNGRTYVKAAGLDGVQDWGDGGIARAKLMGYSAIPDPSMPKIAQSTPIATGWVGSDGSYNPAIGGGGGGAPVVEDTTAAARAATQRNIDAADVALRESLEGIDSEYRRILKQYADEEALNLKAYRDQTTQNEQNRTNTTQASLLASAQGGRGLRATLAALGALGGTGELLANRAVASEANKDIGEGNRVFDTNATTLTNARAATEQDEKNRRNEASAARQNQHISAKANAAQQKQSLFEKMAGFWTTAGNNAEAARYMGMVGDMAPQIAKGATVKSAAFTPRSAVFNPGKLSSYLGGRNDMTVETRAGSEGGTLNSPLFALTRKREEQLT